MFSINDLKKAVPEISKTHPFLPDRHWLAENLEEKLTGILDLINQGKWSFPSIEAYFEWQEKPIPAVKMSTQDWLVHFAILEKIEEILKPHFVPNTHYQINQIDGLLRQCQKWKNDNPTGYIFKTDIQSFFKNIHQEVLLNNLKKKIASPVLINLVKNYLISTHQAMERLQISHSDTYSTIKKLGLPIGAELNYCLASAYLLPIDNLLVTSPNVLHYARYVDDILLFVKTEKVGILTKELLKNGLQELGLSLNVKKSKLQSNILTISFLREKF